ncbi:MAG: acetate/propionate family kinase [Acidobacteriaceae bacterium]
MPDKAILVINTGSSSLKFGLYVERGGEEQLLLDGSADGIGRTGGSFTVNDAGGGVLRSEQLAFSSQSDALDHAACALAELSDRTPSAVGHRVVHGGPHLLTHQLITPAVLDQLRACLHLAPLHIPIALELIDRATRAYPRLPQFACFDSAFHSALPEIASRLPLPRDLFDQGIRRYGFHGLSYESVVFQMGHDLPGRTVVAHLGSGASLAALRDGRSVDTSMGLTPTGGIPMATRTGDLDPGVILFLLRSRQCDADTLEDLLNHGSGLKALSGGHADMRDLETAAGKGDPEAQLALDIFCTSIRKEVAAYAAVLGGLDMLIFSGGIGEHSALVRRTVCRDLGFLGISMDDRQNNAHRSTLSPATGKVQLRIVPSQEDRQIARHCRAMLREHHS